MSVPWLLRGRSWNGESRIWRHRAETHSSKYHILDIFADSGVVFSSLDTRGLITVLSFWQQILQLSAVFLHAPQISSQRTLRIVLQDPKTQQTYLMR